MGIVRLNVANLEEARKKSGLFFTISGGIIALNFLIVTIIVQDPTIYHYLIPLSSGCLWMILGFIWFVFDDYLWRNVKNESVRLLTEYGTNSNEYKVLVNSIKPTLDIKGSVFLFDSKPENQEKMTIGFRKKDGKSYVQEVNLSGVEFVKIIGSTFREI